MDLAQSFALAMQRYEEGRLEEARALARRIEKAFPGFAPIHYLFGLLALADGKGKPAAQALARALAGAPDEPALHMAMARAQALQQRWGPAETHYRRVLAVHPGSIEARLELAGVVRRDGRAAAAEEQLRAVLAGNPDHPEANNDLGTLLIEGECPHAAAEFLRAAVAARPDWPSAHNNLAIALTDSGDVQAALQAARRAVALVPDHAGYRVTLAGALAAAQDFPGALDEAVKATELAPGHGDSWTAQGLAARRLGRDDLAAEAFRMALALDRAAAHPRYQLAEILRDFGQAEAAAQLYREVLALDPQDRHGAALGLALLGEGAPPDRAPDAYVRTLFDQYAGRFDQELVGRLGYSGPARIGEALDKVLGTAGAMRVLDLGCGTGLAGPVLKPRASRLDGVDLSPRMLDQAAARGLYDDLTEGELVSVMITRPKAYDLIVAADVLVYLGDLAPVFRAAGACLVGGGRFCFTVERAEGTGFALGAHARYAHARPYLEDLARECGFSVRLLEDISTRREAGAPVPGLVCVLAVG
jgi:predicted TPR repeat methyltransferase